MVEGDRLNPPLWVRWLDAIAVGLLIVTGSIFLTGGFRQWTPFGIVSAKSWWRPLIGGVLAITVRHAIRRRPTLVSRIVGGLDRCRRSADARVVWPVFLSTRIGVLLVGFLGIGLLGYAPHTPPYRPYGNDLLDMPARWDTGWYMGIALNGYRFDPAAVDQMQNVAFFPLYPMLMRYVAILAADQVIWVGVAISLCAFFWAAIYLLRWARVWMADDAGAAGVALLAAYPFALFYSTAYTESLFLLTTIAACYHFERGEIWKGGVAGLAAGLTRPNGSFLSVVLGLIALRDFRRTPWRALVPRLALASTPAVGMLLFSAYMYHLTGNPLQWAAQHAAWGRVYRGVDTVVMDRVQYVRENGAYAYASTRGLDLMHAVAALFALGTVWPVHRRFGAPYATMIVLTVLPALAMGGLLSMGRVTSVLFPTFVWLGGAIPTWQRTGWLVGFAMIQALCAIAFFTWRPLY